MFISYLWWISAISNTPSLRNISKHTREESCSGRTASKTTVDAEQHSQSTEHQLCKVAAEIFLGYSVQSSWHGGQRCSSSLYAGAHVGSIKITAMASERPHMCLKLPPSLRPQLWDPLEEPVILHLTQSWEPVPSWKSLYVHQKAQLFLSVNVDDIKMCGKKEDEGPVEGNSSKRNRLGRSNVLLNQIYLGLHPEKSRQ